MYVASPPLLLLIDLITMALVVSDIYNTRLGKETNKIELEHIASTLYEELYKCTF